VSNEKVGRRWTQKAHGRKSSASSLVVLERGLIHAERMEGGLTRGNGRRSGEMIWRPEVACSAVVIVSVMKTLVGGLR